MVPSVLKHPVCDQVCLSCEFSTAIMGALKHPGPLSFTRNVDQNWKSFIQRFELYLTAIPQPLRRGMCHQSNQLDLVIRIRVLCKMSVTGNGNKTGHNNTVSFWHQLVTRSPISVRPAIEGTPIDRPMSSCGYLCRIWLRLGY